MSNVIETVYASPMAKPIDVVLPVFLFQEDDLYHAYCPHLEINGYGMSENEAKSSFDFMLVEFLEYTVKNKTLRAELESLGWTIQDHGKAVFPPDIESLASQDENLSDILNHKNYRSVLQLVNLLNN